MAELAVMSVLGVVQIMTPLLRELNLPIDVSKDVQRMKRWLSSMRAFMEANYWREGQARQTLVEEMREIAYAIEDVVDDFTFHSPPYSFHHNRLARKIHFYCHQLHHNFPLTRVSDNIESIRKDIDDIKWQSTMLLNPAAASSSSLTNRATTMMSPLLLDHDMVGYESHRADLMRRLVDGDERLLTIAVDGPAGSGKTMLVKTVFSKLQIQAQFDCHAWVHVSQLPDIDNIFEKLLRKLCSTRNEPYPSEDGSTLRTRLRTYLVNKRYLVVLDDFWKEQHWNDLKGALPDSKCGSRIIFTTRHSNLSSVSASSSHVHVCSLHGLESSDAWELFCRRAFQNGECPSELKDVSTNIMKRCEGLPHAIVAVAGALAQKPPTPYKWERFHYMDLSSNLKCCFLYMSIFPEDYTVERGRLIRLWVAERFAMATEEQTAEEVAEDYLSQLINRNLLQVASWDFGGRPKHVRVLNHMLKFIIQECKDENFASIFPKQNANPNYKRTIRRLAIHDNCSQPFPENDTFASVRSMFLLRVIDPSGFEKNLSKLKLIKVLDVQGGVLTKFPEQITRFTLMRYLSFRDTKIKSIPSSIEKLSYLETLDLQETDVVELPREISNLYNLCHLFAHKSDVASGCVRGVKLHPGICNFKKMQSLSVVEARPHGTILKDLKALTRLRKLGVTGLRGEHGKHLWAAVEAMTSLKSLDITSATKAEVIEMVEMQHPPKSLQRLNLKGRLTKIPTWIGELDDLLYICLKWSKLMDSPLKTLKRLRKLRELHLVDCYSGEDLTFEASGFKMLKILVIKELSNVNTIKIEHPISGTSGAMPELKNISLHSCPRVVTMVLGVAGIELEELTLYNMAKELVARLSINGEDREYVQHIPLIHSFTFLNHKWSLRNLSAPVSFSPR